MDLFNLHSNDQQDTGGTIFRDVIMLALAGFIIIVMLLLPHINPPNKNQTEDIKPPGNVMVEMTWPENLNIDLDLWVKAPGDIPVGYSNKAGKYFNLLRDDLGNFLDVLPINYENAITRGIIPGEYIINVHYYRGGDAGINPPVKVKIVVSTKKDKKASSKIVVVSNAKVLYVGHEITIVRFKLDLDGALVDGSINHITKKLRDFRTK
jgi:hypothetical protein